MKGETNLDPGLGVDFLINSGERVGSLLGEGGIKTHQIRRFFDAVKNIDVGLKNAKNPDDEFRLKYRPKLLMLKPQLANATAKKAKLGILLDVTKELLKYVHNKKDFDRFMNFFESVVAYHYAKAERLQSRR